ncbi:cytoplasmic dynein 2 intermediate chain 2 [Denticeps clupeoides]|uniref:Anaphase-promoting complex subunit 4-like WD40 domain-containing protein n=1 Tax=Denticeps clupeoides TaxID=299321 RepID=A0AAY4DJD8_9TELE|nr:WD repeat-containing protein 34 [Denticeps clupeoides]
MFTDEALDVVGADSSWRKSHQLTKETKGCQTTPLRTSEVEAQASHASENGTQTDPPANLGQHLWDHGEKGDPPRLKEFLHQVEHMVIKELVNNCKSHAFDGYDVNWSDQDETVSCVHRLQHPDAQSRGLQVTSVSWSCTGSVIACAFGRTDNGDWSTERSCVCTWNLDRSSFNPKKSDLVVDVPCPVMCLCFHPTRPSLIAGGLYSGEVMVWDTSRTQDPVLAQTGMSPDTHREPVCQVHWVPGTRKVELDVLSAGSGGRVLQWSVDITESKLVLGTGYALVRQQVPLMSTLSKVKGGNMVGITSLALSLWDLDSFLVGSEGGMVLKCSFSSQTVAAVPPHGESVTLRAPAQFSFSPQSGPVHSLHCSPFHRNLFLSVGTDGMAHLHSLLQPEPLLSLRVSESYVFAVRWSPTRPLVFAAATGQGLVQIFDLERQSLRPAATIDQNIGGQQVNCLEFNQQTHLLAVGNSDGTVNIWQLSAELTTQGPKEVAQLEQLASEVLD